MRLLVGLGNPGPKYAATRHNFGFLLLDRVSQALHADPEWKALETQEQAGLGRWERFSHPRCEASLLWPLTFMNLSGKAVDSVLDALDSPEFDTRQDCLVVIDDLSLALGRVRIRPKGSSGGHNGLKSVEAHLGHQEYARLKLGIGRPDEDDGVIDFVLEPFSAAEEPLVDQVLDYASDEVLRWLQGANVSELSQSMNGWSALVAEKEEAGESRS